MCVQEPLPRRVAGAVAAALERCAPRAAPSEASALLSSAARIRFDSAQVPVEALLATALRALDAPAAASPGSPLDTDAAPPLVLGTSETLTDAASVAQPSVPLAVSGLLWALAHLQPRRHAAHAAPLLAVVTSRAASFTPVDTALIVWALSRLEWPLGAGERAALRRMVRAAAPYLSTRETAMVARGVAALELDHTRSGSHTWAAIYEAVGRAVGTSGDTAGAGPPRTMRAFCRAPDVLARVRRSHRSSAVQARRRRSPARRPSPTSAGR